MKTKLKLGIIGAGAVVREIYQHLYFRSHYSHLLDICAVADPNEQYRNWFADLAGVPAEPPVRRLPGPAGQGQTRRRPGQHPRPPPLRPDRGCPQGRPGCGRAQAHRRHRQGRPRDDPGREEVRALPGH